MVRISKPLVIAFKIRNRKITAIQNPYWFFLQHKLLKAALQLAFWLRTTVTAQKDGKSYPKVQGNLTLVVEKYTKEVHKRVASNTIKAGKLQVMSNKNNGQLTIWTA